MMTPEEIKAFVEASLKQLEERVDKDPFQKGYEKAMERVAEEVFYSVLSKDEVARERMEKEAKKWIEAQIYSEAQQRKLG